MIKGIKRLFYVPKHEKITYDSLKKIVLISVIGIVFSAACLVSLTWAWFSDSVSTTAISIKTTEYGIQQLSVTENGNVITPVEGTSYSLEAGKLYTVSITAKGNTRDVGYFTVKTQSGEYSTVHLPVGSTMEFTLVISESGTVTFSSCWQRADANGERVGNGGEIAEMQVTSINDEQPTETEQDTSEPPSDNQIQ